jgi:hypothetical protein
MPEFHMPSVYPHGGPLYWADEQSGVLPQAVTAYLQGEETPEQLALVLEYVRYWLKAPCWRGDVQEIRQRIDFVTTRDGLQAFLSDALAFGIDPL